MQDQSVRSGLRVCYFGTYRANYTRSRILLSGLRAQGVTLYECHARLWHGVDDRVQQASGGWRSPRFWARLLRTYWRLFRAHNRTPEYDVMLVGYPGQFDVYLGRLLTWWRGKPMALDILMSLHLIAEERGLTEKSPFTGRLIFWLEKVGLRLPDLLIAENSAYEAYIRQKYDLAPGRFRRVPHGADDRVFYPRRLSPPGDYFQVTYHGLYLPSHGLDTIIGAAELLRDYPHIRFRFYGDGPERVRIEQIARQRRLENVRFMGYVSGDELLNAMARSHVCLGVFGTTKQSYFTIQNKIWEGLAMGRAVISGDSPTIRQALIHKKHIYLIERDNPQALADGLLELVDDLKLREQVASAGQRFYTEHNTPEKIGEAIAQALSSLVSEANAG